MHYDNNACAHGELGAEDNLRALVQPRRYLIEVGVALLSGIGLSLSFSPLEWGRLAWIVFLPLLLLPTPRPLRRRLLIGYLFGFSHFVTSLWWLNTIGFGAGVLLAAVCAVFPMLWYGFAGSLALTLAAADRNNLGAPLPRSPRLLPVSGYRAAIPVVCLPAAWTTLEWIRAWLLTGFPWNQLGVSQWRNLGLLRITSWTGVYGISFLIVMVNVALAWLALTWYRRLRFGERHAFPWPVLTAILLLLPAGLAMRAEKPYEAPDDTLKIGAAQGNIPQIRTWRQEQLNLALNVYDTLSRQVAEQEPDLIVWPETAVPAPVRGNFQFAELFNTLMLDTQIPFLIGTLDYRPPFLGAELDQYLSFNSAFYYDAEGVLRESYDKIHLVPFGEFVPLNDWLPWLEELIGMGRGLIPGTEYTLFKLPKQALAGVNICYEDVYAGISRQFVLRGANLLITLTNDAWYAESAGSRQHMIHAVFRATENRRPMFRSGNNSDTCLILPDGRVQGLLYDEQSGSRFHRGARLYQVPIWTNLPLTFYTRHGDIFALTCLLTSLAAAISILVHWTARKQRQYRAVVGERA